MVENSSVWDDVPFARFPKVAQAKSVDVVVIGGGITGLTAAWLLKQAGKRVCLLERGRLCHGDTGMTTAHLTSVTDLRLAAMHQRFGGDATAAVWAAGATAIRTIEDTVAAQRIDCAFQRVPGYLHSARARGRDDEDLQRDLQIARKLGLPVTWIDRVPLLQRPGLRFANQAKFHPLKYLSSLARLIPGKGCSVHENSEATDFSDAPRSVTVNGHRIRCEYLVIATHVPLMGNTGAIEAALLQTKLAPYSSYVIEARVEPRNLPEALYWDTSDPYFYLRIDARPRKTLVIFGGCDHKTGQEARLQARYRALERRLRSIVPRFTLERQWSGQVIETNDGLPYIGETAEAQFVATGFAGNGTTFGTIAAVMARDAVLGRANPWQGLFSVDRRKLRGGTWRYLTENLDYPYYLVRDRLKRPAARSPRSLERGQGLVLKIDGEWTACSRDRHTGALQAVSAVCTHMGCIVHWNESEHTWDCPCHGSRFQPDGSGAAGPAETPLKRLHTPSGI